MLAFTALWEKASSFLICGFFCFKTAGHTPVHSFKTMGGVGANIKSSQFEGTDSGLGGQNPSIWSSREGGVDIGIGKKIFCNRSLNMKNIVAVGFDMDYTLAQYMPETFEALAYEGTVGKLVNDLGYPQEVHFLTCSLLK